MLKKKLRNVNARMPLSFGNDHKTNYWCSIHVSRCGLEQMCQNNLKPYVGELFGAVSTDAAASVGSQQRQRQSMERSSVAPFNVSAVTYRCPP